MSKDDAIDIMKNSDLKKVDYYILFSLCIKISETTYYKRKTKIILNRGKEYYENNKEALREKAKDKYKELSDEEKKIKRECGRNIYHNMSEEKNKD